MSKHSELDLVLNEQLLAKDNALLADMLAGILGPHSFLLAYRVRIRNGLALHIDKPTIRPFISQQSDGSPWAALIPEQSL